MNEIAPEKLVVPPLRSGGIMLGYGCTLSCRHCNYRCGPDVAEWMDDATLEAAFDALTHERRLIDVHLGGGEATLKPALLEKAIRTAVEKNIRISYLETNGFYAETAARAVRVLAPLRDAGLKAILVSVSPYHNEALSLRTTINCLEAGWEVFGQDGVFPWLGHFLPMLSLMDERRPHPLEAFLQANGMYWGDPELLRLFPLSPGGRVPLELRDFFEAKPAEAFRNGHCLEMLTDVTHFHIDPYGNLFTGHCPGIASGRLPRLHEEKTEDDNPAFVALAFGGPCRLMDVARRECGFQPDPRGYISPCDLCFQVRRALVRSCPEAWPELAPASYYRD